MYLYTVYAEHIHLHICLYRHAYVYIQYKYIFIYIFHLFLMSVVCVNIVGLLCLWLVSGANSPHQDRPQSLFFYLPVAHSDTQKGRDKSWARHGNASQSSRRSCSFHAWACGCVHAAWARVLMMCERACKHQRGGGARRRRSPAPSRSILSTLMQKSSISLNLTATNLWLHYYRRCFILVPTRKPGAGLVNGEGDGEGDQPEPLLCYWVGWALKWKSLVLYSPFLFCCTWNRLKHHFHC